MPAKAPSASASAPGAAVVATFAAGGTQHRARTGDTLLVNRMPLNPGDEAVFNQVVLAEFPDGTTAVGNPRIPGAEVRATVEENCRGEKLRVFKLRRRKNSKRAAGHRQDLSRITVRAIECPAPSGGTGAAGETGNNAPEAN